MAIEPRLFSKAVLYGAVYDCMLLGAEFESVNSTVPLKEIFSDTGRSINAMLLDYKHMFV